MASVQVASPIPQKPAWKPGEYKTDPSSPPKSQKREARRRKNVKSPELYADDAASPRPISPDSDDPSVRTSAIYVHDDVVNMYVMNPDEGEIERIETTTKDKSIALQVGEPEVRVRTPSFSRASLRLSELARSSSSLNSSFTSPPLSPRLTRSQNPDAGDIDKTQHRKSDPLPSIKLSLPPADMNGVQDFNLESLPNSTGKPPLPKHSKSGPLQSKSKNDPAKNRSVSLSSKPTHSQTSSLSSKDSGTTEKVPRPDDIPGDGTYSSSSSVESLDSYNERYIPGSLQNLSTRQTVTLTKTRVVAKSQSDISFDPPSFVTSIPKPKVMTRSQTDLRKERKSTPVLYDIDISEARTLPKPKQFKPGVSLLGLPRPYTSVKDSYGRVQFSLLKSQVNEQIKASNDNLGNETNNKTLTNGSSYSSLYPGYSRYSFGAYRRYASSQPDIKSEVVKDERNDKPDPSVNVLKTTTTDVTHQITMSVDMDSDKENVSEQTSFNDIKSSQNKASEQTEERAKKLKHQNKDRSGSSANEDAQVPSQSEDKDTVDKDDKDAVPTATHQADAKTTLKKKKKVKSKDRSGSSAADESLPASLQTGDGEVKAKKKKTKNKDKPVSTPAEKAERGELQPTETTDANLSVEIAPSEERVTEIFAKPDELREVCSKDVPVTLGQGNLLPSTAKEIKTDDKVREKGSLKKKKRRTRSSERKERDEADKRASAETTDQALVNATDIQVKMDSEPNPVPAGTQDTFDLNEPSVQVQADLVKNEKDSRTMEIVLSERFDDKPSVISQAHHKGTNILSFRDDPQNIEVCVPELSSDKTSTALRDSNSNNLPYDAEVDLKHLDLEQIRTARHIPNFQRDFQLTRSGNVLDLRMDDDQPELPRDMEPRVQEVKNEMNDLVADAKAEMETYTVTEQVDKIMDNVTMSVEDKTIKLPSDISVDMEEQTVAKQADKIFENIRSESVDIKTDVDKPLTDVKVEVKGNKYNSLKKKTKKSPSVERKKKKKLPVAKVADLELPKEEQRTDGSVEYSLPKVKVKEIGQSSVTLPKGSAEIDPVVAASLEVPSITESVQIVRIDSQNGVEDVTKHTESHLKDNISEDVEAPFDLKVNLPQTSVQEYVEMVPDKAVSQVPEIGDVKEVAKKKKMKLSIKKKKVKDKESKKSDFDQTHAPQGPVTDVMIMKKEVRESVEVPPVDLMITKISPVVQIPEKSAVTDFTAEKIGLDDVQPTFAPSVESNLATTAISIAEQVPSDKTMQQELQSGVDAVADLELPKVEPRPDVSVEYFLPKVEVKEIHKSGVSLPKGCAEVDPVVAASLEVPLVTESVQIVRIDSQNGVEEVTKHTESHLKDSISEDVEAPFDLKVNLPQTSVQEYVEMVPDKAVSQVPEIGDVKEVVKKKKMKVSIKKKKVKDKESKKSDSDQTHAPQGPVTDVIQDVQIMKKEVRGSVEVPPVDLMITKISPVVQIPEKSAVTDFMPEKVDLDDVQPTFAPSVESNLVTTTINIVEQVPSERAVQQKLQSGVDAVKDSVSTPASSYDFKSQQLIEVSRPDAKWVEPAPVIQTLEEKVKPKVKKPKKKKKKVKELYEKNKQVSLSDTSLNKMEMSAVLDEVMRTVSVAETSSQKSDLYFSCESLPVDEPVWPKQESVEEEYLDCTSEQGFPSLDTIKGYTKVAPDVEFPQASVPQTVSSVDSTTVPSVQGPDTRHEVKDLAADGSLRRPKKKKTKNKDDSQTSKKSKKKMKVQMTEPESLRSYVADVVRAEDLPDMSDEGDPWSDSSRSNSLRRSRRSFERKRPQEDKLESSTISSPGKMGQRLDVMIIDEIESPERRIEVERIVQSGPPVQGSYEIERKAYSEAPALPSKSPIAVPPLPLRPPIADTSVDYTTMSSDVSVAGSSTSEPTVTISPAKKSKYPPRTVSMPPDKRSSRESGEPVPEAKVPEVVSTVSQPVMRKSALKKGPSIERVRSGHDTSADTLDSNGDNPKKKVAIALPHQATADVKARVSSRFSFEGGPPSPNRTPDEDLDSPMMADVVTAQEAVDVDGPLDAAGKEPKEPIQLSYIDFFPARLAHEHKFATFDNLVDRANIWLEKRPSFVVFRCETVEFKKRNMDDGKIDNNNTSYREIAGKDNKFIKALRLWMRDRIRDDPQGPDFLGYFNILPHQIEQEDGTTRYSNLTQAVEYTNSCLRSDPVPGKLLNVEHLEMKLIYVDDELDPDCNYWVEDDRTNSVVYFVRVFFKRGEPIHEDIECIDFVPKITHGSKSLGKCAFENYSSVVKQARDWLAQRKKQYGRLLSVQSVNYRATHNWGPKNPDTYQMLHVQGNRASTHLIQCIRLTLTKVANEMDVMPGVPKPSVKLYHKSFRPILLTKPGMCSKITFETLSQTMDRAMAWITAAKERNKTEGSKQNSAENEGCQVFGIETSRMRVKGGNRTLKPDNSHTALHGEDELVLYFIRVYLDGYFEEPPPEDLPPVPEAAMQDPCCSIS